jgi:glycosyltransferase involved in cell wall biosynthesis
MRVAIFTETFVPALDGVVTRLRSTIDELLKLGDEMMVIAPSYGEGPAYYHDVPIHRVASVPFPPYPQIKLAPINPRVGPALKNFKPDLIHAVNPFVLGSGAPFYARRLGVPLVASYHTNVTTYARFYGLGIGEKAGRWWTRTLHNKATVNLCTSETTRKYLSENGVERLHVWPQGVDTARFHPRKRSEKWRLKLSGGHPDAPVLLYVGRLGREKSIGSLKAVLRAIPDARLALVGDGPARRELEVEFAGMPAVFSGTRRGEELTAAYASADALVFPSTTETLGLAMLEALSSGLPVVAARAGAAHEVVEEGMNGLLYDPEDRDSLVEAVRRILGDEGLRARLKEGARATAETRDWEAATRALRGYYEMALTAR